MLKVSLWILLSWFIQRKVCEKRSSITAQVTRIIIIQDDNKKYYRQSKESQNRRFNYVCHFWLNEWRDEYLLIEAKVTTDSLIMFLTQVWILNTCASSFIIFDETILIILQVYVTDAFISIRSHCLKIAQSVAFESLTFSINFCPIKIDLSGNTVWPQASGFEKLTQMDLFWHF